MNVQPGLPDDPKYLRLKKALRALDPDLAAMELLIRLWGHCQENTRGELWTGADPDYVECVLRWDGDPGLLCAVLVERGWVTKEEGGMRIHAWEQNNEGLVSAWFNGRKGGRKKAPEPRVSRPGKPDGKPDGKPTGNRTVSDRITGASDAGNPTGEPMNELNELKELRGKDAPPRDFPEVEWPTEAEVLTEGQMRNVPEAVCRKFHNHYEGKIPKWTANGQPFDWRRKLWDWKTEDEIKKTGGKKPEAAGHPEIQAIRAELQWQTNPERIQALQKRLRELGG